MKKLVLALIAVVAAATAAYAAPDRYVSRADLPATAQAFLDKYFANVKISAVKVERHVLKKNDYDVKLVNGTTIDFNNAGEWTSVDCKTRAVPTGIVPAAIRSHVKTNFDNLPIVEIDKKSSGYEVTLSDGVEIKYDKNGTFKGYDFD